MKRFYVTVEISVYAKDEDAAKAEVRKCLNTGRGHIHGYVIGDAEPANTPRMKRTVSEGERTE